MANDDYPVTAQRAKAIHDEHICIAICDLFDAMDNLNGNEAGIVPAIMALPYGNPDRLVYMHALRGVLSEAISEATAGPVEEGSYSGALLKGVAIGLVIVLALYCCLMIYAKA